MAAQQKVFNLFFVVILAFACIIAIVQASPVSAPEAEAESSGSLREGRFYGMGGSQASAMASANAGAGGFGYPYGGGLASSSAMASANAGSFGYGK